MENNFAHQRIHIHCSQVSTAFHQKIDETYQTDHIFQFNQFGPLLAFVDVERNLPLSYLDVLAVTVRETQ